jgi:hypothetical protein
MPPEIICLLKQSSVQWKYHLSFPSPIFIENHHSILCLYDFHSFIFCIHMTQIVFYFCILSISHRIMPFRTVHIIKKKTELPFINQDDNVPLHGYTTKPLHLSMDIEVISIPRMLWIVLQLTCECRCIFKILISISLSTKTKIGLLYLW